MNELVFFGKEFSLVAAMSWIILIFIVSIIVYLWKIQSSGKLDFADMFTKDGKSVSLTKVLQFIGGLTATWIMIKMTVASTLTPELFAVYLAYVGGVEAYSKFVSARYNYSEKSVKQTQGMDAIEMSIDELEAPAAPAAVKKEKAATS